MYENDMTACEEDIRGETIEEIRNQSGGAQKQRLFVNVEAPLRELVDPK